METLWQYMLLCLYVYSINIFSYHCPWHYHDHYVCVHNVYRTMCMAPSYLKELLHIHSRDSRLRQYGRLILRQPIARKRVEEQSFKVVAPKLWNTLPEELRAAQSLNVFEHQLKTHLFNIYFN